MNKITSKSDACTATGFLRRHHNRFLNPIGKEVMAMSREQILKLTSLSSCAG